MASNQLGQLPEFDVYMDFTLVRDAFDAFIANNNIPIERYVYVLLSTFSASLYTKLRNDLHPVSPKDLPYAAVIEWLNKQFSPEKVFHDRQTFYRTEQSDGETTRDWFKRVEQLAEVCGFGYFAKDEIVRDRFVCGLRSRAIFQRMTEQEPTIKMEKALQIAIEMEENAELE